ncbi:MAG: tyrosine-type recombinase/integrase [Candidatus Dormibacteraceae bacterium]
MLPRIPRGLPKPIKSDELPTLLNMPSQTLVELRDRALVMFLLSTGCRITEALMLDRTAVPYVGDSLYVIGKGNKERLVRLVTQAKAALHDYLRARADRHPALFLNYDRGGHRKGHDDRLTVSGAEGIMHKLQRRLGVWSLTSPHVLRHTAATILLEVTGGNAILVAEILGHADLRTVPTYAAVMEGRFSDAYSDYGARLAGLS